MDIELECWECKRIGVWDCIHTIGDYKTHNKKYHPHFIEKCSSCPLRFSYPGELQGHLIDVDNHVKTQCMQCHYSGLEKFMDEDEFKKHNFAEHSECKEKCNYCPNVFYSAGTCREHMVAWHDHPVTSAKLQCIHCKKPFLPKDLERHNRDVHKHFRFKCSSCLNVFKSSGDCDCHACPAKGEVDEEDGGADADADADADGEIF